MVGPVPASPFVISYFTHDIAANRRFYGEILGLPLQSEQPDVYFLCGASTTRLQILKIDPSRLGRSTVSSGLVLIGVDTDAELAALHDRARAAGLRSVDGWYQDPDGRLMMAQVFDRSQPFHD